GGKKAKKTFRDVDVDRFRAACRAADGEPGAAYPGPQRRPSFRFQRRGENGRYPPQPLTTVLGQPREGGVRSDRIAERSARPFIHEPDKSEEIRKSQPAPRGAQNREPRELVRRWRNGAGAGPQDEH